MRALRPIPATVTTVFVAVFLVLFAYAWRVPITSSAPRRIDSARAIAVGEAVARASVGDPESARFRSSFVSKTGEVATTCGEVNYKRATGGYGGFQRFVAAGTFAQLEEGMGEEQFRRLWSVMCNRDE